jgi:hypothetical protein
VLCFRFRRAAGEEPVGHFRRHTYDEHQPRHTEYQPHGYGHHRSQTYEEESHGAWRLYQDASGYYYYQYVLSATPPLSVRCRYCHQGCHLEPVAPLPGCVPLLLSSVRCTHSVSVMPLLSPRLTRPSPLLKTCRSGLANSLTLG